MPMSHEECRGRICIMCFSKAKELRNVTEQMHKFIQKHCGLMYDPDDSRIPTSICGSCRSGLLQAEGGASNFSPAMYDFRSVQLHPFTRLSNEFNCDCTICKVARATINFASVGLPERTPGRPPEREEGASNSATAAKIKICTFCCAQIGPGMTHDCKKSSKMENIRSLIFTASPTFPERLATTIIRDKIRASGDSSSDISLASSSGKPMRLSVNSSSTTAKPLLTTQDVRTLQNDLGLSARKTKVALRDLRCSLGQNAVQGNIAHELYELDHQLDDLFEVRKLDFVHEDGCQVEPAERSVVVCTQIEQLISKVSEDRCLSNFQRVQVRVGIDGGGGFLKFCLSIFELDGDASNQRRERFVDTGVKKALIVGLAPDTQENYTNIKLMWDAIGLNLLPTGSYTIACDLKVMNILLGIMAHSCLHPCSWCSADKHQLWDVGQVRTFGSLRMRYEQFLRVGGIRSRAKEFDNVIHPCIIVAPSAMPVIEVLPPPELHLLTGTVQVLYDGLHRVWPESSEWLSACHVQRDQMHGGSFTGNASRILLRNADLLASICPLAALPFVPAIRALNQVVEACFSKHLNPNFLTLLSQFAARFADLQIEPTPKVHAVVHHVAEFCRLKGTGLGPWGEQTIESLHHDFLQFWQNYRLGSNHPDYATRLLSAVQVYNSRHL